MDNDSLRLDLVLDWPTEQIDALAPAQIETMAYGINYFEFGHTIDWTPARGAAMQRLRERLTALRSQPMPAVPPPAQIRCDCGHTVSAKLAMGTARGTACPDCYDTLEDDA